MMTVALQRELPSLQVLSFTHQHLASWGQSISISGLI
jgi:hypothetical protein